MTTRAEFLAAQGELYDQLFPAPPPPPPPPPPSVGPWRWDAAAATVAPLSAGPLIAAAKQKHGLFSAECALQVAAYGDPTYSITVGTAAMTIRAPLHTSPGHSTDGHLALYGNGTVTDLWKCSPPNAQGMLTRAGGGAQFPASSVNEPGAGNSNAARFSLAPSLVTPAGVTAHELHTLAFALPANLIGAGAGVYPANTQYGGTGPAGSPRFGAWARYRPGTPKPPGLGPLAEHIFDCLLAHGMALRDSAGEFTIYGLDTVNQGGIAAWQAAGVTLTQATNAPGLWYAYLSPALPWDALEILLPPPVLA